MEKAFGNLRSGIILVALCLLAYFWLIPAQIKVKEGVPLGPDFFPRLMVICCALCGAGIAVQGAFGLWKAGKLNSGAFRDPAFRINWKSYSRHLFFFIAALAYLLAMPYAGFVIASIIFLPFLLLFFGHSKLPWCFLLSVVYVTAIYLLFTVAFKISFPKGPFGF